MRSLLVAAAFVVVTTACSSAQDAPDQQWALVENHIYIDHLPKNERDMVKNIAFLDHEDAGHVGIRGQSSRFRMFLDVLTWNRRGNVVMSRILQTNTDVKSSFRAWRCKGKAPAPFELCLELGEGDRKATYYSKNDWIIESAADVDRAMAKLPLDE